MLITGIVIGAVLVILLFVASVAISRSIEKERDRRGD